MVKASMSHIPRTQRPRAMRISSSKYSVTRNREDIGTSRQQSRVSGPARGRKQYLSFPLHSAPEMPERTSNSLPDALERGQSPPRSRGLDLIDLPLRLACLSSHLLQLLL